jgi:uncharacterized membrane-anchored protein
MCSSSVHRTLRRMLRRRPGRTRLQPLAAKVPEVGLAFWLVKVLTTGIGEAASDAMGQRSIPVAGIVGVGGFALALWLQRRSRRYQAVTYWSAVLMVAVFGTMVADGIHDGASVPYSVSTTVLLAVVAGLFWRWKRSEGTLSIHSITTRRREGFYWATVLATFALGTAAGDLTAIQLHLGFLDSVFLFGAVIAVPAILWWKGTIGATAAFWSAYVVTRPLGASVADWLGKPHGQTGLGLGDGTVSLAGLAVFAALVAWLAVTRRDVQDAPAARRQAAVRPAVSSVQSGRT